MTLSGLTRRVLSLVAGLALLLVYAPLALVLAAEEDDRGNDEDDDAKRTAHVRPDIARWRS